MIEVLVLVLYTTACSFCLFITIGITLDHTYLYCIDTHFALGTCFTEQVQILLCYTIIVSYSSSEVERAAVETNVEPVYWDQQDIVTLLTKHESVCS